MLSGCLTLRRRAPRGNAPAFRPLSKQTPETILRLVLRRSMCVEIHFLILENEFTNIKFAICLRIVGTSEAKYLYFASNPDFVLRCRSLLLILKFVFTSQTESICYSPHHHPLAQSQQNTVFGRANLSRCSRSESRRF